MRNRERQRESKRLEKKVSVSPSVRDSRIAF